MIDHNERSEWREFCNGAPSPSTTVQSVYPPTASPKRRRNRRAPWKSCSTISTPPPRGSTKAQPHETRARRGRAHACLLTFDVSDLGAIKPLAQFQVSELDSPFSRVGGARFGAHQFCERMSGTIAYAVWFGGGLRIIDVADPLSPREVGHFMPEPAGGRPAALRDAAHQRNGKSVFSACIAALGDWQHHRQTGLAVKGVR